MYHNLGKMGEEIACKYLISKNYTILNRNYYCREGELDIVGQLKGEIVFFEVKSCHFKEELYSFPEESVNRSKIRKIINTAYHYISANNLNNFEFRFDIITVEINLNYNRHKISHFINAFED